MVGRMYKPSTMRWESNTRLMTALMTKMDKITSSSRFTMPERDSFAGFVPGTALAPHSTCAEAVICPSPFFHPSQRKGGTSRGPRYAWAQLTHKGVTFDGYYGNDPVTYLARGCVLSYTWITCCMESWV